MQYNELQGFTFSFGRRRSFPFSSAACVRRLGRRQITIGSGNSFGSNTNPSWSTLESVFSAVLQFKITSTPRTLNTDVSRR